jgi:hypothetical protein
MGVGGKGDGGDGIMVAEDVILGNAELEIEYIKELALDPSNVPFAEHACAYRPMHILQGGIIQIL